MSRLVKIVDNKYVQIEEYRNPNICFNTNEYDNFENYCILRKTFDPFKMFYENQQLKKQLEEINKNDRKCGFVNIEQVMLSYCGLIAQQKEFIEWLEDKIQQQETVIAENQEKSYFLIYDDEKEDLKLSSQKAYIRRIILEEILQKYREVIGVSDEKK